LADAFAIPRFGDKCTNFNASGTAVRDTDYINSYLAAQTHPYLFNQAVNPATYNEDVEADTYLYFRSRVSSLNQYLKNVRYRSTMKKIDGVCNYGLAELEQFKDLAASDNDKKIIDNSKASLKAALDNLKKGNATTAKSSMVSAQNYLHQISTFWNDEDILTLRYRLATLTNMGKKIGIIAPSEANPPTYDLIEPFDNVLLNWQVLYGYDEWDDPGMRNYILENLYIDMFAMMGMPMKISSITEDTHTILFDPTNTQPDPMHMPVVLLDHYGNRYNPETTPYDYDMPMYGYGPFLQDEPVYDIPEPNGFPDFFEAVSNPRLTRYRMQGGWEWQRARQWPDDMKVANKLLDTNSNINIFFFWGMDNQVFEDIVHRIADSGTPNLLLNASNNLYAEFTWKGYRHELNQYIASSSNPSINKYECPTYGKYNTYIKGLVDALEQEVDKYPDESRKVVSLVSHGFPYHDYAYTAYGYPGCSMYWLPGSPYDCGDIWPTGYIYGEDPWHQNNWDQFDLIVNEITTSQPGLFARLDSNNDGNIKWDELWLTSNMFAAKEMDPYDLWAETDEMFNTRYETDWMGGWISKPPILKQKIASEGQAIDYFIDIPYFWDKESSETLMHRMMLFGGEGGGMGDPHMSGHMMIWFDENIRSEAMFMPEDHTMHGWDGTEPMINVTVTRMLLEGSEPLHNAMVQSYSDGISLIP
jgi:hypothetical protein